MEQNTATQQQETHEQELTADQRYALLTRLKRAIDIVRTLDANLPTQAIAALLAIAQKEGRSVKDISDAIGIAPSSGSRNISMLSDWDWKKRTGLALVEYRIDRMTMTTKNVHLTQKGKLVIEQLVHVLNR